MAIEELKQKEQELSERISKVSADLSKGKTNSDKEEEYFRLHAERSGIINQIKKMKFEELKNKGRRPLPDTPEKLLTSADYFEKKKEVEAREQGFRQAHEEAIAHLNALIDEYDRAVVNGTDEEIANLYDDLEAAKHAEKVARSKVESLQNNTKEIVLDDAAMEVFLSRIHIKDTFDDERKGLEQRYKEALQALKAVEREVNEYNSRCDQKLNDYQKVMIDRGDNSGIGTPLFSKYQEAPHKVGHGIKIPLNNGR